MDAKEKKVFNILKEHFQWQECITENTYLDCPGSKSNLDLTPIGIVRLLLEVESIFDIRFEEYENFKVIEDVVKSIVSLLKKGEKEG